jgi:maleylpyruvate isomerase
VTPPPTTGPAGLDTFRQGEAFFLDRLAGLADAALLEPCALEGWSRRHLVSHFARNADAMVNLFTWARTGEPTPMYPSAEHRVAGIEAGATRPPDVVRADAIASSARLLAAADELAAEAWDATVRTGRGRRITAAEVPWLRIRESWVHTVDLAAGASFADLPPSLVDALLDDVIADLAAATSDGDVEPLRLVDTTTDRTLSLGTATAADPTEVRGPAPDLLGWLTGRTTGATLQATTPTGHPPAPPRWF